MIKIIFFSICWNLDCVTKGKCFCFLPRSGDEKKESMNQSSKAAPTHVECGRARIIQNLILAIVTQMLRESSDFLMIFFVWLQPMAGAWS